MDKETFLQQLKMHLSVLDEEDIAEIIEESDGGSEVTIGRTVTFIELPDGEKESYTIVGSAEADPFEGKISNESPIAKGLLGKSIDDEVMIQTPAGDMLVKIIAVE